MDGFVLIIYLMAMSLSCMSLALGLASNTTRKARWGIWYVVFQSCQVFNMFICFGNRLAHSFMPPHIYNVFNYILPIITSASMGFSTVLLPYFCSSVLLNRWGKIQRICFYPCGVLYFVAGLVGTIVRFREISDIVQTALFLGVFIYCIVVVWSNLLKIDDVHSRNICLVVNIVSIVLMPTSVAILFFPFMKDFAYPIYIIAFSVIMMIYFFIRFGVDGQSIKNAIDFSPESLSEYRITEREVEVIKHICMGKSNKEIASIMNISVNTVNNHVANIFEKMNISSRMELMRIMKTGPWA